MLSDNRELNFPEEIVALNPSRGKVGDECYAEIGAKLQGFPKGLIGSV